MLRCRAFLSGPGREIVGPYRSSPCEAHLPAEQGPAQPGARVSQADEYQAGSQRPQAAPRQGPEAPRRERREEVGPWQKTRRNPSAFHAPIACVVAAAFVPIAAG